MPPKKKPPTSSKKKKGKQNGGSKKSVANAEPNALPTTLTAASDEILTKPDVSVECAKAFEALFSDGYPPKIKYDDYVKFLSCEDQEIAVQVYNQVVAFFNNGNNYLTLKTHMSGTPKNKRWQLAQQLFLDALSTAMKCPALFLNTEEDEGADHRMLLCKVASCLSLIRGKFLDSKGMIAWAKAAISVYPTYHNVYGRYALGLLLENRYEESLENYRKMLSLGGSDHEFSLLVRNDVTESIANLEIIVNSEPKSKEWMSAIRHVMEARKKEAAMYYSVQNMERPKISCAMCFWPAEEMKLSCSKCLTVYYCHQHCQFAHWPEHKHNCITTKQKYDDKCEQTYPKPNYPTCEWETDEQYKEFQDVAKKYGCDVIHFAAGQGSIEALKRALMVEMNATKKINSLHQHVYPIHSAAERNEPFTAAEICRLLIKHGACPNVYRGDNLHLLDICRSRAKWFENRSVRSEVTAIRMSQIESIPGRLEEFERKESTELVELITEAIKTHTRCKLCKSQKATRVKIDVDDT